MIRFWERPFKMLLNEYYALYIIIYIYSVFDKGPIFDIFQEIG